ncbi:MAG: rhodanese-like domain-containing protein [Cytophagaceae bacterium]|nr:rhodanese-like domain-containing protein [Cytophagaceae bacterium]
MKKPLLVFIASIACALAIAFAYTPEKLMDSAQLAERLKTPSVKKPVILNVGPSAPLPGSQLIGNAEDPANREKLKSTLKNIPKNSEVVLYCGCCKLEDCWNIHEADKVLSGLGYTHYKILNLPTDFNKDWVDKKYPLQ